MTEEPITDADHAHLRFAEFGTLPARVRPEEYVELVETEPTRGRPESAESEEQNRALRDGG
jgi:hypothetical protein